jgi:predicted nuclease of predicted toxin-antitoxin system
MRILCDQHVAGKHVRGFEETPWITVAAVRDELSPDATDREIVTAAATDRWVVFTNDDDFYRHDRQFGLLVYSQVEDPSPSDIVKAVAAIEEAYAETAEITETVPDGWI